MQPRDNETNGLDLSRPKVTSYEYGRAYQEEMEQHYWDSQKTEESNHDRARIKLAERLIMEHGRSLDSSAVLLDVGCSVGLFATYFSKLGYRSIGIDFDKNAIEIAERISKLDGGSAEFIIGDLADSNLAIPPVDIAILFDILEHLHDDEIGALLANLKRILKPNGILIFHTLPMQYDYVFWNGKKGELQIPFMLIPFVIFSTVFFEKAVRCYALFVDIALVLFTNKTWRERIKKTSHCNPLTKVRLEDIFRRGGWEIIELKTGFLTKQFNKLFRRIFEKNPITHRSLYGVCAIRCSSDI